MKTQIKFTGKLQKEMIKYCEDNCIKVYWDYRDSLSQDQAQKVIEGKLWEVENEIDEMNMDYWYELEKSFLDEMISDFNLEDEDENFLLEGYETKENFRDEFLIDYINRDLNIKQLLDNTTLKMRITIHSNYEGFSAIEGQGMENDYIREVYKLLKNHVDKQSFKDEVLNSMCYTQFIFYGNVNLGDVYTLDFENWKEITINDGCICGLFDSWNGSGSVLEVELKKPITIKRQYGETEYDNIAICIDEAKSYSVMETYGLGNVKDLNFNLK